MVYMDLMLQIADDGWRIARQVGPETWREQGIEQEATL